MHNRLISIFFIALFASGIVIAQGDESQTHVRSVGILSGRAIRLSSPGDIGDDGIFRLQEMLVELGADVQIIAPDQSIPDDLGLLVIIRPQRSLSITQTDILWNYLRRGGHLLFALDPYGHADARTELARTSGINAFLELEYGLYIRDNTLIEPWFGMNNLSHLEESASYAWPEELDPHPITAPLVHYDMPIQLWGAREIAVSSPNGKADTNALLYVETAHGELTRINYSETQDSGQIQFNLEDDAQGRLIVAGIAEHYQTGSRVALVGDSEIFQNLYGQAQNPTNPECPLYAGDYLFAQRLLAWLMEIPQDEWPSLPANCTPIVIDGDTTDWDTLGIPIPVIEINDTIQDIRVFHNDQYLYLALTLSDKFDEQVADFEISGESRSVPFTFGIHDDVVSDSESVPIADAAFAMSDAENTIEIRVPLRSVGDEPDIRKVCQNSTIRSSACVTRRIRSQLVPTTDPVPMRITSSPTAILRNGANLRSGPSENDAVLAVLPPRVVLAVRGRNESGNWLYVTNARYEGWLSTITVSVSADMDKIPIVSP